MLKNPYFERKTLTDEFNWSKKHFSEISRSKQALRKQKSLETILVHSATSGLHTSEVNTQILWENILENRDARNTAPNSLGFRLRSFHGSHIEAVRTFRSA